MSSCLFLLALGMCGLLARSAVRGRNHTMDQNQEFRQAFTHLQLLQRDLLYSRRVYWPDPHDYNAVPLALVLAVSYLDRQQEVVSWHVYQQDLVRQIYRPDYDPAQVATHQSRLGDVAKLSAHLERAQLRFLPPGLHGGAQLVELQLTWGAPVRQEMSSVIGLRP